MAEGLISHDLAGKVQAFSTGIEPSSVNPLAIAGMMELGIDISGHRSKSLDEFLDEELDFVITLCDHAAERCPVFFGGARRVHMGFPNPRAPSGSDEERLMAFRKVRDQIREEVVAFLTKERRHGQ